MLLKVTAHRTGNHGQRDIVDRRTRDILDQLETIEIQQRGFKYTVFYHNGTVMKRGTGVKY